jgi:long-chain acyl-CoA synthetase
VSTPRTLLHLLDEQVAIRGEAPVLRSKQHGTWRATSFHAWQSMSRTLAAGLIARGIAKGDRFAILLPTRQEWAVLETAILMAGAIPVPIYPTLTPAQVAFIVADAGARGLVCEDAAILARLEADPAFAEVAPRLAVRAVIKAGSSNDEREGSSVPVRSATSIADFAALHADGLALLEREPTAVSSREESIGPSDIAGIYYTSGTTGEPKGVVITHAAFLFEIEAFSELLGVTATDEQLLFLPLAHIFGKILLVAATRVGFCTAFAQSMLTVLDDAEEVRPTFFGSVPRLFEKLHEVANAKAKEAGEVQLRIFRWAIELGQAVAVLRRANAPVPLALELQHRYADKLVFSKVRKRFGGRLRFAVSGAAPLDERLAEWFHAIGVPIYEGYGLTETTAATTLNRPLAFRFGTVGRPLPGVETQIGPDGEVLVRGPNLFREYWQRPRETEEAIDSQGWFHTGDIGVIDADGFLRITDRKKDLLITAGGKNVAPQRIEALLCRSRHVARAVVLGDRRPYLVALIVPAPGADSASIQRAVDQANAGLASFETVKRFAVLDHDLSVDGGELTATLKVRRNVVEERFAPLIESLY